MLRVLAGLILGLMIGVSASAQSPEPIDPRARVSMDPASRVPDHIGQPVGPPATTHPYEGKFEAGRMYRIGANPEAGFHWPYLLFIPEMKSSATTVLVEPNNDGLLGAPFESHEYWAAIRNEQLYVDFGRHLHTPLLTPVFPRPLVDDGNGNLYIHAMSREAMISDDPRYARPDLQLLAMLEDARTKLEDNGVEVTEDALFWGFSAAADFVTRMTVLHPDRVKAVAAGGLPILPLASMAGETLTFPVGVGDMEAVTGRSLDAEALRKTPVLLYQGGSDENDSVPEPPFTCDDYGSDSYNCEQALWVNATFGASAVGRVDAVRDLYDDFGMSNFNSILLPGIEHRTPDTMTVTIRDFFACVLAGGGDCAASISTPTEQPASKAPPG